jgi:hypothetical protein
MADSKENIKRWAEAWERAEIVMEKEKSERLTDPDYYTKTMAQFGDMLNYATDNSPVEMTSGLIEMQRYFKILAIKNGQSV